MRLKLKSEASLKRLWLLPFVAALFMVSSWLTGCNNSGCTDNHSALPLMGFYDGSSWEQITLDSIDFGGVGAPDDSLLIHSGQRVSQVYLPFRSDRTSTSFYFHYDYKLQGLDDPELDDVITFFYESQPYFASSECGAMFTYRINRVEWTNHLIENVIITDSVITNIEREHIMVFFRTIQPDEDTIQPDEEAGQPDQEAGQE